MPAVWMPFSNPSENNDPYMRFPLALSEQSMEDIWEDSILTWINEDIRNGDQQPDDLRAHLVISGLEPVSKGLLSRYEVVRGEDHTERTLCAVCYQSLDLGHPSDVKDRNRSKPNRTEVDPGLPSDAVSPEMVALPCLHIFHSECLTPWLALKAICPTCRFDVDPDSLASNGGSAQRPWVPPAKGVLEAWVQAEERKRSPCPQLDNSAGSRFRKFISSLQLRRSR